MIGQRPRAAAMAFLAFTGCSCPTDPAPSEGLECVRGHDEVFNDSGLTEFVCDEYAPRPTR